MFTEESSTTTQESKEARVDFSTWRRSSSFDDYGVIVRAVSSANIVTVAITGTG